MKVLFLQPLFQERIWGGTRLSTTFNYEIPSDKTGECWAISAHKNGDCTINNGPLKGKTLSEVYALHRELFANSPYKTFPLLTKILDANNDLSVQVHPDDDYALRVEQDLGKTECWYIIDCDTNAEMVFGHHAKSKAELIEQIENNQWEGLLRRIKIQPGDFFYVPSGTIHALCKGTLVLETQQSSDTTYRVYDYNRKDEAGHFRPLHINKAIDVTTVPHQSYQYNKEITKVNQSLITTFVKTEFFTVEKWEINGNFKIINSNKYYLVSVLKGHGKVLDETVCMGDHFIITSINEKIYCQGNMELIVSYI